MIEPLHSTRAVNAKSAANCNDTAPGTTLDNALDNTVASDLEKEGRALLKLIEFAIECSAQDEFAETRRALRMARSSLLSL